jgi:hypothetical protein
MSKVPTEKKQEVWQEEVEGGSHIAGQAYSKYCCVRRSIGKMVNCGVGEQRKCLMLLGEKMFDAAWESGNLCVSIKSNWKAIEERTRRHK